MVAPQHGQRKDLHRNFFMCAHTSCMAQSHHLSSSAKEMRFPLLVCFAPELADISISQLEVLLGTRPDISEDVWFRDQYQDADVPLVPVGSIIGGFIQYPHESDATKFRLKSHGVCISIDDPSGLETSRPATDLSHDRSVRGKDFLYEWQDLFINFARCEGMPANCSYARAFKWFAGRDVLQ